ncbi:hypothetical protein [Paenibacillus ginsengarvi]|uniref:Uncharacterized protein n=1 Tax=Paenibacillus ginsengarvi TaxID=400777 RepID=A0A3B0BTT7_9BACL|nr:hypothetical protein [Paenibacillus ginsengarvi]RKN75871.1 hypothetical protein D7M11_25540 [Paenibacillus ginsengarvi]
MRYFATVIVIGCLWLLLVFRITPPSYGKALILPPDQMLEYADVIFTGNIIRFENLPPKKNEPGPYVIKRIYVKVEQILKGDLDSDIVILRQTEGGLAVHQTFPVHEYGQLLILQRKLPDNSLSGVADTNNLGIIRGERVAEVIGSSNAAYVSVYDQFYQAGKIDAKSPTLARNSAAVPLSYGLVAAAGVLVLYCCINQYGRKKD